MSKKEEYEQRAEALLTPIVEKENFELVDVEYVKEAGNWFLRAYIDKENGITIDDCELVSRAFSDLLDEQDFIEDSYILEVSSPGLGRQLKKEKDFARSIGEEIELKLYKAVDKQKEFTGILVDFDKDVLKVEIQEDVIKEFPRKDIAMVRLALDF